MDENFPKKDLSKSRKPNIYLQNILNCALKLSDNLSSGFTLWIIELFRVMKCPIFQCRTIFLHVRTTFACRFTGVNGKFSRILSLFYFHIKHSIWDQIIIIQKFHLKTILIEYSISLFLLFVLRFRKTIKFYEPSIAIHVLLFR